MFTHTPPTDIEIISPQKRQKSEPDQDNEPLLESVDGLACASIPLVRPCSPPALVPSADYCYEDGDVIIQVENTLYKVHRFLLSKAIVFNESLLLLEAQRSTDGRGPCIPELEVDDIVRDFEVYLRLLYRPL